MSGLTSHLNGKAAEDHVMRHYVDGGHRLVCRRWRGKAGEIDLVMFHNNALVFVEVKAAKSLAQAALRLTRKQSIRLLKSAEHCLGYHPQQSLTHMRFDVAFVDRMGRIEILENALTEDGVTH